MKFQDSSFNGLKITLGDPCMHTRGCSKSNMPNQLFQSWGINNPKEISIQVWNLYATYMGSKFQTCMLVVGDLYANDLPHTSFVYK